MLLAALEPEPQENFKNGGGRKWLPHTSLLHAANVDSVLGFLQSFPARVGLGQFSLCASLGVFSGACGVTKRAISFFVCPPLERCWPLTGWSKRNSIAAD